MSDVMDPFSLVGKTAVVVGGGGVLGGAIAAGFARMGATVAVTDLYEDRARAAAERLSPLCPAARADALDVLNPDAVRAYCKLISDTFGPADVLVNAVGGNLPAATTSPTQSFPDLPLEALRKVLDLNFLSGTLGVCQAFVPAMATNPEGGSIINISSMNASRPLTRIPGYSAAKAAVENFTRWLAVHVAMEHNPRLRVNAIAPGFFLTDQNRYLLRDPQTGEPTERSRRILDHTPMGLLGEPDDLVGASVWLASDASRFVTGIVVPVDGGFSAYAGV